MPGYRETDPRLPKNRLRLMWEGAKEAGVLGEDLPIQVFDRVLVHVAPVNTKQARHSYKELGEMLGLMTWEKGEKITWQENGLEYFD